MGGQSGEINKHKLESKCLLVGLIKMCKQCFRNGNDIYVFFSWQNLFEIVTVLSVNWLKVNTYCDKLSLNVIESSFVRHIAWRFVI